MATDWRLGMSTKQILDLSEAVPEARWTTNGTIEGTWDDTAHCARVNRCIDAAALRRRAALCRSEAQPGIVL